jgi:hypothetical protein
LPGEKGDIYIIEANMQSLEYLVENPGGAGNKPQAQPKTDSKQQNSLKKAYERLFSDALNRVLKRENADIQREIKREGFTTWVNDYYKEPPEFLEKNLLPVFLSYFEAKNSVITEEKTRELCRNFSKSHCERALKAILEGKELQVEQIDLLWKELNENE